MHVNDHPPTDKKLCAWVYRNLGDSIFEPAIQSSAKFNNAAYSGQLYLLENFIDELLLNGKVPFIPFLNKRNTTEYRTTSLARCYFLKIPGFIEVITMLSPHFEYSERINVFIACCDSLGLLIEPPMMGSDFLESSRRIQPHFGGVTAAEIFNNLVERIRSEWVSGSYKLKLRARKKEAHERFVGYCNYVNSLFDVCSRQIVLRVDLYYKKEFFDSIGIHEAVADLNHLFENKRCNSIFKFMNGYIAKIEYGIEKGIHFHTIFFFDGSKRNNYSHVHLAQEIGEYWINTITKGRGDYWNSNAKHKDFAKNGTLGVGGINYDEHQLRFNLLHYVVGYLCKMDQFIKPKFGSKVKLIRRGAAPKIPLIKLGRPRTRMDKMISTSAGDQNSS